MRAAGTSEGGFSKGLVCIVKELLQTDSDVWCQDAGALDGHADGRLSRGQRRAHVARGAQGGAMLVCNRLVQYGDVGAF